MNRKSIIYCFVAALLLGGFAWLAYTPPAPPPPSIRFVEFRDGQYGRVGVFRVSNDSSAPFSFYGYGPTSPIYRHRVQTAEGWRERGLGWCGTGAGLHTILPHTSTEIQVHAPDDAPASTFAVGIHFERGTSAQLSSRSRSRISEFIYWLRYRLNSNHPEPEPTWSSVAQNQ